MACDDFVVVRVEIVCFGLGALRLGLAIWSVLGVV